ncbi:glutathione S-transferase family protein [Thalassotalea marina]|uniref:Glutathione S-transferase n=1 Tax=Thalassotalea marina TaxID=1673741 RepID=A0A919BB24_9GAMM|nr:glutathione S-transferase family protein [Thalassotalea marina]GHF77337.1 glutathione S-transferase [Thalassotalea marina]
MKLLGSTTSPFVRRLRTYLEGKDYQFVNLDIFAEADRKYLTENNPALKVPALIDNEQCIYDSRVIFRYLAEKYNEQPLSWQQENLLTLIDSVNDSLVSTLILKRSNIDTMQDALFFNLQRERIDTVLKVLDDEAAKGSFTQWHYPSICLWCLLDWAQFRELTDWRHYSHLSQFFELNASRTILAETDPRI